jgi:toxin CcdB
MARFDVYRLPGRLALLVVDVQADLLSDLMSRVVVPLEPKSSARPERLPRLEPEFRIAGKDYIFKPTDIAVLPSNVLRKPVANVEADYRNEVVAALDFLFFGF